MDIDLKQVFLFRHGQTDWNKLGRFQGHTDIPLNDTGRTEAASLISYLKEISPEVMITSDLQRAVETANIANSQLNLQIHITPALRETHLGDAEGKLRENVDADFGTEAMFKWSSIESDTLDYAFPNGETKQQVIDRVFAYLESFLSNTNFTKIAVSTHGGVIKRICHYIAELENEEVPIRNCCLYKLEFAQQTKTWRFVAQLK